MELISDWSLSSHAEPILDSFTICFACELGFQFKTSVIREIRFDGFQFQICSFQLQSSRAYGTDFEVESHLARGAELEFIQSQFVVRERISIKNQLHARERILVQHIMA
jgi:hypothetical protein